MMTDRAFVTVISAVLTFVIGLVCLGLWGEASTDCDAHHGVLVTDASGFGWACVQEKR